MLLICTKMFEEQTKKIQFKKQFKSYFMLSQVFSRIDLAALKITNVFNFFISNCKI